MYNKGLSWKDFMTDLFLVYNNATIILSLEWKMVYEKLECISVFSARRNVLN